MSSLQRLLDNYERQVSLPFTARLHAAQRVWFVLYSPEQERRLRFLLPEFAQRTRAHGKEWHEVDVTDAAPRWVAGHEYREAYLRDPGLLNGEALQEGVGELVAAALQGLPANPQSVAAIHGLGGLFGFGSVAALVEAVQEFVPGRLLCFFPGSRDGNSFHFMDARDGWNYHALTITDDPGFLPP